MTLLEDFQERTIDFINQCVLVPLNTDYIFRDAVNKRVDVLKVTFHQLKGKPGGRAKKMVGFIAQPHAATGDPGFDAYWLPFVSSKSKRLVLGNQARFMFTAEMTGCTFGVGSQVGTDGHVLVGHANAYDTNREQDKAYTEQATRRFFGLLSSSAVTPAIKAEAAAFALRKQREMQTQMLNKKMDPGSLKTFEPEMYMNDSLTDRESKDIIKGRTIDKFGTTIIGFRDRNASEWRFYAQRRVRVITNTDERSPSYQYIMRDLRRIA